MGYYAILLTTLKQILRRYAFNYIVLAGVCHRGMIDVRVTLFKSVALFKQNQGNIWREKVFGKNVRLSSVTRTWCIANQTNVAMMWMQWVIQVCVSEVMVGGGSVGGLVGKREIESVSNCEIK